MTAEKCSGPVAIRLNAEPRHRRGDHRQKKPRMRRDEARNEIRQTPPQCSDVLSWRNFPYVRVLPENIRKLEIKVPDRFIQHRIIDKNGACDDGGKERAERYFLFAKYIAP